MTLDWWTLGLQTVNIAILVWLLQRFLYRPVLRLIDARRSEVDADYAKAAQAETDARAAREAIEAERVGIAAERAAALKSAAAQAEESAAARSAQAGREAEAMLAQARAALAKERAEAATEIRETAIDLGLEVAGRLIAELPAERRAAIWLDRVIAHLGTLPVAERQALTAGGEGPAVVRVVTDDTLPDAAEAAWRTRLAEALGAGLTIEFDTDAALVAGAEVHFPNTVLRFSWRSALDAIRSELLAHGHAG